MAKSVSSVKLNGNVQEDKLIGWTVLKLDYGS